MSISSYQGLLPMGEITKVYCSCGCIVDLDKRVINLKQRLGKDIECMSCRNNRISADIDILERHFSGCLEEDSDYLW
ncbi:MAG: hypothetical protein PHW93_06810 [Candidatus Methanomethylophilaceae archaeon]|jgi:hypothetical protein|nr:hypothetical protein [Candidatus Methanomethylophilaceae archaeon]